MKNSHKVLWTEGMFLRPHHFQQAEDYLELRQWSMREGLYPWGFSVLRMDESLLSLGKVALAAAAGILPDGTPFEFADAGDAPAALDIRAGCGALTIVLALPIRREGRETVIFNEAADSPARYLAFEKEINDANALSMGSAKIQCGRLRLRLLPQNELNGEWQAMGAVRVLEKDRDGCVVLDQDFIPPLLDSRVSPSLRGMAQELAGLLQQRRQRLGRHLQRREEGRDMTAADLMLQALLHRFSARVSHLLHAPRVHPERLFAEWLPFALELAIYRAPHAFEGDIPRYDHADTGGCFEALMSLLRQGLFIALEESAIPLPLTERMPGLNLATLPDKAMLDRFDFVLAVGELAAGAPMSAFLAQIKIAPVCRIRDVVQLQLPGIPLRPLPQAPRQLPLRKGASYFALEHSGGLWQPLAINGVFALYLTGEFARLDITLWAVRRSSALGGDQP
ncbi:type VI secretion system baseplate subunit TssK [Enterobacteriales bacterium SAP-6]|uniref:Type VI secretion system baseplate subunit TssK n=2 Tax=Acerihabitans arboris TaxID=2691583 RepID=A0A845SME1_9GAMM|nr:type VI secretion system baseplate subunit TssK [Acerihabitans arboris]